MMRQALVSAALPALLVTSGCDGSGAAPGEGSCTFAVGFRGHGYVTTGHGASPVRGVRIGTAREARCGNTSDPHNEGCARTAPHLRVYSAYRVVGRDPGQVIWLEPAILGSDHVVFREDPRTR